MTLYLNYEEAQRWFDSDELFVVRIVSAVHRSLLANANQTLQPQSPFDMRYFYGAIVRAVAGHQNVAPPAQDSEPCKILASNIPDLESAEWKASYFVQSGLAAGFVELVQRDSEAGGCEFDLGFACQIAARALDRETLHSISGSIGAKRKSGESFDEWVEGFTVMKD